MDGRRYTTEFLANQLKTQVVFCQQRMATTLNQLIWVLTVLQFIASRLLDVSLEDILTLEHGAMNALRDSKYRQVLTFEVLKGKITALQHELRNDEDMDYEEESKLVNDIIQFAIYYVNDDSFFA